jgi:hypothetical protein
MLFNVIKLPLSHKYKVLDSTVGKKWLFTPTKVFGTTCSIIGCFAVCYLFVGLVQYIQLDREVSSVVINLDQAYQEYDLVIEAL